MKDYNKHLTTKKHKIRSSDEQKIPFRCECGKIYKHASSLWNHKQKCNKDVGHLIDCKTQSLHDASITIDKDLLREILKQNNELRDLIMSQNEQISKHDVTINNNNSNNTNNFNISVFLNEHCKDAINFSDFIDNIQISHEDLQNNAQLGFVGGISKIITDNLKQLTIHERPIHCTDAKRETMYIKDQDSWQKDKILVQQKLNSAIQEVSRKSVSSLMKWKQTNPDYADMDSDFSNLCLIMQQQSIAGMNREKFYPKVIHRIAECVPCKGV